MTAPIRSRAEWDVFVSYSRSDAHRIGTLVPALRAAGLRVFVDDTAVDDFASITTTITEALAQCRALLALYSAGYPQRRACQWELTYAYLAGQHEGDPRRRTLVVNPEPSAEHVHPVELRDARHWPWPAGRQAAEQLAGRVAEHVKAIDTPMGEHASAPFVRWLPAPARTGSVHFVGRLAEQWHIHTALHRQHAALVVPTGAGRAAQLRGMAGIGKTLLAQEYALRFGSAFPGGIFWFDLHRHDGRDPSDVMAAYEEQVCTVLSALGVPAGAGSLPGKLSHLAVALEERHLPCLWVVDGVPDGLTEDRLHLLRGPHLLAATLITTRSRHYTGFAECVDVAPLAGQDSVRLLTARRAPHGEPERAAAAALVRDVDGHPQALDLLAVLAAHSDFVRVREGLHAPGRDVLVTGRRAAGTASGGGHPPLAGVLSQPLPGPPGTDDVLRLFALGCPAALSQEAVQQVLLAAGPYPPWEVAGLVGEAVETLLGSGLLRPDRQRERTFRVHPLLARAVRRHDVDTARQEDLRGMLLRTLTPAPDGPATDPATDPGTDPGTDIGTDTTGTNPARGTIPQTAAPPGTTTSPGTTTFPGTTTPSATATPPGTAAAATRPVRDSAAPGSVERAAAFDVQVELVTRVGVQPLEAEQGSLREALTSLHTVFATGREALHRMAGETAGPLTLPAVTADLLNTHLRPFLATWHAALAEHEAARPPNTGPVVHERRWERAADMRAALADLRAPLTAAARDLAALCGVDLLVTPAADEPGEEPEEKPEKTPEEKREEKPEEKPGGSRADESGGESGGRPVAGPEDSRADGP